MQRAMPKRSNRCARIVVQEAIEQDVAKKTGGQGINTIHDKTRGHWQANRA